MGIPLRAIEQDDLVRNILAHSVIDAPSGQNHLGMVPNLLSLVCQVVGVHPYAVPPTKPGLNLRKFHLVAAGV